VLRKNPTLLKKVIFESSKFPANCCSEGKTLSPRDPDMEGQKEDFSVRVSFIDGQSHWSELEEDSSTHSGTRPSLQLHDSLRSRLSEFSGLLEISAGSLRATSAHSPLLASARYGRTSPDLVVSRRDSTQLRSPKLRDSLDEEGPQHTYKVDSPATHRNTRDADPDASDDDESGDWGKANMRTQQTPGLVWARNAWERRENATRRRFGQKVVGAVLRDRDAAEHRLLNGGGGGTPIASPSSLRRSRIASLARSRAETIGDTSATSDVAASLDQG